MVSVYDYLLYLPVLLDQAYLSTRLWTQACLLCIGSFLPCTSELISGSTNYSGDETAKPGACCNFFQEEALYLESSIVDHMLSSWVDIVHADEEVDCPELSGCLKIAASGTLSQEMIEALKHLMSER